MIYLLKVVDFYGTCYYGAERLENVQWTFLVIEPAGARELATK